MHSGKCQQPRTQWHFLRYRSYLLRLKVCPSLQISHSQTAYVCVARDLSGNDPGLLPVWHTVHIREREKTIVGPCWVILKECEWKGLGTDWPWVSVSRPCLPARFYSSLILSLVSPWDPNPLMFLKDWLLSCSAVLHTLSEGMCVALM